MVSTQVFINEAPDVWCLGMSVTWCGHLSAFMGPTANVSQLMTWVVSFPDAWSLPPATAMCKRELPWGRLQPLQRANVRYHMLAYPFSDACLGMSVTIYSRCDNIHGALYTCKRISYCLNKTMSREPEHACDNMGVHGGSLRCSCPCAHAQTCVHSDVCTLVLTMNWP